MQQLSLLLGTVLSAGMLASSSIAQDISRADALEVEVMDFNAVRLLFSFGPRCRFIMPSIHVYDLAEEQFLGGDELGSTLQEIASKVASRTDSADECSPNVSKSDLEAELGHPLPRAGERRVVFFFDLPGAAPFERFSEGVRTRRDRKYDLFVRVESDAKVHLRLSQARF